MLGVLYAHSFELCLMVVFHFLSFVNFSSVISVMHATCVTYSTPVGKYHVSWEDTYANIMCVHVCYFCVICACVCMCAYVCTGP